MTVSQSCSDFEIRIEQRLQDALPADEGVALDAHLATCATCATYLAAAAKSQGILSDISRSTVEDADWQAATTRFQGALKARRRRLLHGLLALLLAAPFSAWALSTDGRHLDSLVAALLSGGSVLAFHAGRMLLGSRSLARVLASGTSADVLELQRRYLRGRLKTMTRIRVVGPVAVVALLACALVPGLIPSAHPLLGFSVLAAIVAGGWLRMQLRDLPRARRELEELGGSRDR